MLLRRTSFFAIVASAGFILTGEGLSSRAIAAVPAVKSAEKGAKSAEVEELHKAKALLEKADHDYDGHRARAVEDIDKAIHALHHRGGAGGKSEKPEGKPREKSEGRKEPQGKSDIQLHEAKKILEEVEKQLLAKHAKGGGEHHEKAAKDVKHAIEQLHEALRIR